MIRFPTPLRIVDIRTPRLIFRPFLPGDLPAVAYFCADPQAQQFIPFPPGTPDEQANAWFQANINRWKNQGTGMCVIADAHSGAMVGLAGLLVQELEYFEVLEIAYHLLPQYRGRGYATEAANALRNFAFQFTNEQRLYSIIHELNIPSQKVAHKNGMVSISASTFKGIPVYLFVVERNNWQAPPPVNNQTQATNSTSSGIITGAVMLALWIGGALFARFLLDLFTNTGSYPTLFIATLVSLLVSVYAIAIASGITTMGKVLLSSNPNLSDAELHEKQMKSIKAWLWLAFVICPLVFAVVGAFSRGHGSIKTYAFTGVIYALLIGVAFVQRWINPDDLPDIE